MPLPGMGGLTAEQQNQRIARERRGGEREGLTKYQRMLQAQKQQAPPAVPVNTKPGIPAAPVVGRPQGPAGPYGGIMGGQGQPPIGAPVPKAPLPGPSAGVIDRVQGPAGPYGGVVAGTGGPGLPPPPAAPVGMPPPGPIPPQQAPVNLAPTDAERGVVGPGPGQLSADKQKQALQGGGYTRGYV